MKKSLERMSKKTANVTSDVVHNTTRGVNSMTSKVKSTVSSNRGKIIPIHTTPYDVAHSIGQSFKSIKSFFKFK
jgi:hypothetical protein